MQELKPLNICPFCGEKLHETMGQHLGGNVYKAVTCKNCFPYRLEKKKSDNAYCWKQLDLLTERVKVLEKALKHIRDNSGDHHDCPVEFCVQRWADRALKEAGHND